MCQAKTQFCFYGKREYNIVAASLSESKVKALKRKGKIYYLDETWLNAGRTMEKVWQDTSILQQSQESMWWSDWRIEGPNWERWPMNYTARRLFL